MQTKAGWIAGMALLACAGNARDGTWLRREPDSPASASRPLGVAATAPIVFRSDRDEPGVGDLYLMASDGSAARPLTSGGDYYFPRWAPDGQSLAVRMSPTELRSELVVMPAGGGPSQLLTQGELGFAPLPPSWSRDGESIAFGTLRSDQLGVWVVARSGGAARPLFPALDGGQHSASWSWSEPSRLAFTAPPTAEEELWLVDATDSAGLVNLTLGRVFAPASPRWSPDGRRIAFSGYPRTEAGGIEGLGEVEELEDTAAPGAEIFVVDVDSRELQRVTHNPWHDLAPVWSPDAQHLLVASNRDGDFDLWLLPVEDPESAVNLVDDAANPHDEDTPDWYWPPSD